MEINNNSEQPSFEALVASAIRTMYRLSLDHEKSENADLLPGIMIAIISHPDAQNYQLLTHVCSEVFANSAGLIVDNNEANQEFH